MDDTTKTESGLWSDEQLVKARISKEQYGAVVRQVQRHGLKRWQAHGGDFKEDDYLMGALAALACFGMAPPAGWVFGLMAGQSPCGIPTPDLPSWEREQEAE